MTKKSLLMLVSAIFLVFVLLSCGGGDGFKAVDVGECLHGEPAFAFKDRIYTEHNDYSCKEYIEVTEKKDHIIYFNWFGEMHCGNDWEYGYEIERIEKNVLKVSILERDIEPDMNANCDNCCYLMPISYEGTSAEEIESIKGIEINYEGKKHTAYFEIK